MALNEDRAGVTVREAPQLAKTDINLVSVVGLLLTLAV